MSQKLIPTYEAIFLTSRYEVSIKEKVIFQLKALLLDKPLVFKRGNNDIFQRCVSEEEMESIISSTMVLLVEDMPTHLKIL